jgi:hypothetical protein
MILIFVDEMNMWTCCLISIVRRRRIEMILIFVDEMNMWTCGFISTVRRWTIEMILISGDDLDGRLRRTIEIKLISNNFFSSFIFDSYFSETLDPNVLRWLPWFLQDSLPKSPTPM